MEPEPGRQRPPRPPGGAANLGEPRPVGGRGVSGPTSQGPWAGLGRRGIGPEGGDVFFFFLLWKRARWDLALTSLPPQAGLAR